MIVTALRPAVDRATGIARRAVRVAVGTKEYDAIRESVAVEGVDYTMTPLTDPGFNEQQSRKVRKLIAERMRELSPADFSEMLRSAMKEDEWLLVPPRRRARIRRRPSSPGDLRGMSRS